MRYARDIMSKDVISVATTMDLRDLAKLFLEKGITGAPVIDGAGHLAGVISQTDLVYYNLTRRVPPKSGAALALVADRGCPSPVQGRDTRDDTQWCARFRTGGVLRCDGDVAVRHPRRRLAASGANQRVARVAGGHLEPLHSNRVKNAIRRPQCLTT